MTPLTVDEQRRIARTEQALNHVRAERKRQERLKARGRFAHTCADPTLDEYHALAILTEEFLEVVRAVQLPAPEHYDAALDQVGDLRHELIHVAAVATASIERLNVILDEAPS